MKIPHFLLAARTPSAHTQVVLVFQGKDKKPVAENGTYAGIIEQLGKGRAFTGAQGSTEFLRFSGKRGSEAVLFAGLGTEKEVSPEKLRVCGANVFHRLNAEKIKDALVSISSTQLTPFAEGMALAAYKFDKYKTKKNQKSGEEYSGPEKILFSVTGEDDRAALQAELDDVVATAESVWVARDWSNEPSNMGTPQFFAQEASRLARSHGLKCRILTEQDARKEGMGLFVGVGQGSEREGRIVVLEYTPRGVRKPKTLAFVGKGITFDSGGISIKPSARMEEMKHDMTGAAVVLGAVLLSARWKIRNRVVGILALTENMPSGNAIQPGNVLMSRAGKTVEVINTDAEGRLILADVLDYAQDFKPNAMINVATLTGAIGVALGKQCCGLFGNNEELIETVRKAADQAGERVWPMPLFDEYFEDLKSDTADMKNSANDGSGGAIRGAIFLKQFVKKDVPWVHLDIASMAYHLAQLPYCPKRGASGLYVRTLARFASEY